VLNIVMSAKEKKSSICAGVVHKELIKVKKYLTHSIVFNLKWISFSSG